MKRLLFLCSGNKRRSPTAEAVFSETPGVEVDSAGIRSDANVPVSEDHIEWADVIIVMEGVHRARLNRMFGRVLKGKQIAVLGIPDDYEFMDPELVERLRKACRHYLP